MEFFADVIYLEYAFEMDDILLYSSWNGRFPISSREVKTEKNNENNMFF